MIYFFFDVISFLIIISFLLWYFKNKMNIISFTLILFNVNTAFFFLFLNYNAIFELFVSIISIILYQFINSFNDNKEIILIKEGNINFHEIINNYSLARLVNYLKIRNITLDEVAYCIKKNNHLIVVKNKELLYPISIIVDGELMKSNLKLIHKDEEWLKKELLNKNLLIKNIDYAYYKKKQIYFINN